MQPKALIPALLGVGVAAFAVAAYLWHQPVSDLVERPPATGDVGFLYVYAQLPTGPARLQPDRLRRLPRPQDFAFQLTVDGTGPRLVRIELEAEARRSVMFEEMFHAPLERHPLDFVLTLGEEAPDDLVLYVTLEAPHAVSVESRFPLRLVGKRTRFWEVEDAGERAPAD